MHQSARPSDFVKLVSAGCRRVGSQNCRGPAGDARSLGITKNRTASSLVLCWVLPPVAAKHLTKFCVQDRGGDLELARLLTLLRGTHIR